MKYKMPLLATSLLLSSCDTVQLQYEAPAQSDDFAAVENQANDGFEYFAFSRMYILVSSEELKSATSPNSASDAQTKTKKQPSKNQKANGQKAPPAAAASDATATNTTKDNTASPSVPLQSAIIEGKSWTASVVPMPSDVGIEVKGVSGFWQSTSLGVSRYENTDIVNSVSSKAENLVPKRLGQIAGGVASIVQIGAAVGVAGAPTTTTLTPFSVAVPDDDMSQPEDVPSTLKAANYKNSLWQYQWTYDSPSAPTGTVSLDSFLKGVAGKKVGYWPVPACRSGTLTLTRTGTQDEYSFRVVVSSSRYLRLQPLSVDGKTDLGSVCSSSTSGSTSSDTFSSVSDDLTALQQAVQTVKGASASGASDAAANPGKKAAKQ